MCPCCGEISKREFLENVTAPALYGERIQALATYFAHQHFLPFDRPVQMFEDIFGVGISPGTCANVDKKLFAQLESNWKKRLERAHYETVKAFQCKGSVHIPPA